MEDFIKTIKLLDPKGRGNLWIAGDFNLPQVDWINGKILSGNPNAKASSATIDLANDLFLTQIVDMPTRKNNILDLFFTTNPTLINSCRTSPPLSEDADHDIVLVDLDTKPAIPKDADKTIKYLYNKADWESIRTKLGSYKLPQASVQEKWNDFENTLKSLMNKFIPTKASSPPKHKPWITREVKTLLHRRDRLYKKWKKTEHEKDHCKYKKERNRCQNLIRKSHMEYTEDIFNKDTASSKFWAYIKQKRKDSCSVAPLRDKGVLISDSLGKANILNRQYCSVFNKDNRGNEPTKDGSRVPTMPRIIVDNNGVMKILKSLNPNKAAGPDKISPRLLKELADVLCNPLTEIFQATLDSGTVPTQWRNALVTPIYKKGDKHNAANYRPVSLTAVCCKICEHIIAKQILNHLDTQNQLSDRQHGFRRKRSCETQLILFIDELIKSMSAGKQTDAIIMDFSKAFDVVPHGSLLVKLKYYGVRDNTLLWIDSFLDQRTQKVIVNGIESESAAVTSGVPQGSVLGPLLFLVYINDMPECIKSDLRLFADDTIIYRTIESREDCIILQQDLAALEDWEKTWGMSFNPSKCSTMHISRKKTPLITPYILKNEALETNKSATYLGITISQDLSWNEHVNKVAAKGQRTLGFIRRNIRTSNKETKIKAYNTLVRPTLEYASSVWSPGQATLIQKIEKVQRRAARYVCARYSRQDSVQDMLQSLEWESLEHRRNKNMVMMLFKIVNSLVAIPSTQLIPANKTTRGNRRKYLQIATRTNYHKYSFFPTAITLWNSLPSDISSKEDLDDFKAGVNSINLPSARF